MFLRKIEAGRLRPLASASRWRGWPACRPPVVVRAQEILRNLERTEFDREGRPRLAHSERAGRRRRRRQLAPLLRRGGGGPRGAAPAGRRTPHAAAGAGPAGRAEEAPFRRRRLTRLTPRRPGRTLPRSAHSWPFAVGSARRPSEPAGADEPALGGPSRSRAPGAAPPASGGWMPLADVYETAEAFVVLMELPGIGEEDVEVPLDGDRLVVRGERHCLQGLRPDHFHRMERSYGPFSAPSSARGRRPRRSCAPTSRTACCGSTSPSCGRAARGPE